ncbi:cystatin-B-like [Hemiscyllium ocellatum]|uniref:cystatin-B-like n=1 Tax=Hemiscyllium ocellatum TaxID=170820 RepID=UPI00296748CE|nr:cystatin-B-like [Hemiscyllium ocellatum]
MAHTNSSVFLTVSWISPVAAHRIISGGSLVMFQPDARLQPSVLEQLKRPLHVYHSISYRSQVVAGMNYFIKVVIGDVDDDIHVRMFQPLSCSDEKPSLSDI